jgi:hypothetical protein
MPYGAVAALCCCTSLFAVELKRQRHSQFEMSDTVLSVPGMTESLAATTSEGGPRAEMQFGAGRITEFVQAAVEFFAIRLGIRWMRSVVAIDDDFLIYALYALLQVKGSFPGWFCSKHFSLCSKAKHQRSSFVCPIPMRFAIVIRVVVLNRVPDTVD